MKIVNVEYLIDRGDFSGSEEWRTIESNIQEAIKAIHWPPQSNSFTLYDKKNSNGVRPIKTGCMLKLQEFGWRLEEKIDIATNKRVGAIDAAYPLGDQYFALEWETGNISSSHRAINKMCLGILKGILVGGVLILPTRKMYYYLTDRIGNFKELAPYFPLWKALASQVAKGLLVVIAIEHDGVSQEVPHIPKGTDGRALL